MSGRIVSQCGCYTLADHNDDFLALFGQFFDFKLKLHDRLYPYTGASSIEIRAFPLFKLVTLSPLVCTSVNGDVLS